MSGEELAGVALPTSSDGRRSTSALGRTVVADALGGVDPAGALDAGRETNWRTGYLAHFRRLIEAGLPSKQAAVSEARDGLASLHRRMCFVGPGGVETGLDALIAAPARCVLTAVTVAGTGVAESQLSLPYPGERLRGSALLRRLEAWVTAGVIEPVVRGRRSGCCREPGLAGPARLHRRGARGGRRSGPAPGTAELGRPGDRGGLAPSGHLGAGPGNGTPQRGHATRPGSSRQAGRRRAGH